MEDQEYIEELLNLPTFYQLERSPNEKFIAFMASGFHENLDVFYLEIENPSKIRSLSNTPELTRFIQWWPDSQSVVVAQDIGGNERLVLYRVYLNQPNVLHPISPEDPKFFMRSPHVTKDEKYIIFAANYNFHENEETETVAIFKMDILSKEIQELTRTEKPVFMFLSVNETDTHILYSRADLHPEGNQIWLINTDGTDDHELFNFGDKAEVYASWHPNSHDIVFGTNMLNGELLKNPLIGIFNNVFQSTSWLNKENEYLSEVFLGKNLAFAYVDRYEPAYLIIEEIIRTKSTYYLYHLKNKSVNRLELDQGNFIIGNRLSNNQWLGRYYSSNQPPTPIIIEDKHFESFSFNKITFLHDNFIYSKLSQSDLTKCDEFMWESEGEMIYGWLYEPKEKSKGLIVYVHGGPTSHSSDIINHEIQYYVHKGYTVLDPNYRGSTGYGIRFQELIKEDGWGGKEQNDIANGVQALINERYIHPGYVSITGTSYGGYSSWYAITKFPGLFNISIPVCGMTDLVIDYETTRPDLRPYSEAMMGGSPSEIPEKYYERSPINYISNISGRLLIIQGANDPNVTPQNVEAVEKSLKASKISYQTLIFKDEGHGIIKKANRIKKYQEIYKFINSALYGTLD